MQQKVIAPIFTHSLEPVTIDEGESATFVVEYEGTPPPTVKWFRYTFPINSSDVINIETTETKSALTILKACGDDSGIFTCMLENIAGVTKSSTNLTVMENTATTESAKQSAKVLTSKQEYSASSTTTQQTTQLSKKSVTQQSMSSESVTMQSKVAQGGNKMEVREGDNIRFDIQFTDGDKSQLKFYHNGQLLNESDGASVSIKNDVATLLIEKAKPSNSGTYECVMTTSQGEAKCQFTCAVSPAQT